MAKRFTAPEKWSDPWFCGLTPQLKLFWIYLIDNCDFAGIWQVNWPLVKFHTWEEHPIDPILLGDRVIVINDQKWFIKKFVLFQQKINSLEELNCSNKFHLGIIRILEKEGLLSPKQGASKPQGSPIGIDIGIGKVTKRTANNIDNSKFDFEYLWAKYPNKDGKQSALKHFKSTVKTADDYESIKMALGNYLKSERVFNGFIKNGSTWFNNWKDWITYKEEICHKCKGKGKYISETGYEIICTCPKGRNI